MKMQDSIRDTNMKEFIFASLMALGIVLIVIFGNLLIVGSTSDKPIDSIVLSQSILLFTILIVVGFLLLFTGLWYIFRLGQLKYGD